MTANNGRNRTLTDADFQAIREIVRTEVREEVHEQLWGQDFTEHLTSIVDGSVKANLLQFFEPIDKAFNAAVAGLADSIPVPGDLPAANKR